MTLKIRELFKLVRFIRRRIVRLQRIEIAKEQMLNYFWKKLVDKLTQQAFKINDAKGKKFMVAIGKIPEEIKFAALKEYVKRCQRLHTVAFMEWRLMFPEKLEESSIEKLQNLIASKDKFITRLTENETHNLPSKSRGSCIEYSFLQAYSE